MGTIGKYALAAGLLGGASFVAWALHLHTRRSLVAEPTSAIPSRGPLPALGAIAALAVFAPLPFVVTNHWSTFLLSPGRTYMHSLALLWAWAMALAVVAVKAVELRPRAVIVPALAIGLVILITLQVNVNRLVADRLKAEPTNGVDVALLLEDGGAATQQERCASLSQVATVEWVTIWLPALNEAYADRFNVTYCASLH